MYSILAGEFGDEAAKEIELKKLDYEKQVWKILQPLEKRCS
jgi:hypothetical protein